MYDAAWPSPTREIPGYLLLTTTPSLSQGLLMLLMLLLLGLCLGHDSLSMIMHALLSVVLCPCSTVVWLSSLGCWSCRSLSSCICVVTKNKVRLDCSFFVFIFIHEFSQQNTTFDQVLTRVTRSWALPLLIGSIPALWCIRLWLLRWLTV